MRSLLKSILLLIGFVHSELSLKKIKKVNKNSLSEKLKYTYFNPLIAYSLLKNDFIANIRFFSSSIKPYYTESGDRNYSYDRGIDSFGDWLVLLFPSSSGNLTSSEKTLQTFANMYFIKHISDTTEEILIENIKSLANIVVKIYKNEILNLQSLNFKQRVERYLGSSVLSDSTENNLNEEERILKIILINAFVVNVLKNENCYRMYVKELSLALENEDIKPEYVSEEEKNEFTELYNAIDPILLYSNSKKPDTRILLCKRESNNVHATILNLCMCLFWDYSKQSYNLDHLKLDEGSLLKSFFEKYPKVLSFTPQSEMYKDWLKVIHKLVDNSSPDEAIKSELLTFNRLTVEYTNKHKNEFKPDIINLMRILVKICDSKANKIINEYIKLLDENGITEKTITKIFEKFLSILAVPNKVIIEDAGRANWMSCLDIKFNTTIGDEIYEEIIMLRIEYPFNRMSYISRKDQRIIPIEEKYKNLLTNSESTIFKYLVKSYIYYLDSKIMDYPKYNISIENLYLYLQGPLYSNKQKEDCLTRLVEMKYSTDSSQKFKDNSKKVCENILRSVVLSGDAKKNFLPFYLFSDELFSKLVDQEKCDIWQKLHNLSNEKDNTIIKNLWTDYIKEKKIVCEMLNLHMLNYSLEDIEKMINIAASSLQKLTIECCKNDIFEKFCKFLLEKSSDEIPNLKSLVIKHAFDLTDSNMNTLTNVFYNHTTIKSVEFDRCIFTSKMKNSNPPEFNPADLDCNGGFIAFRDYLISDDCSLKYLSFKDTKLNINQISALSTALEKSDNLKTLTLYKVTSIPSDLEPIIDSLKRNNRLKSLNLSKNSLDDSSIIKIVNALRENNKLNSLDISYNKLNHYDIEGLIQDLVIQKTKLKKLRIALGYSKPNDKNLIDQLLMQNKDSIDFEVSLQ